MNLARRILITVGGSMLLATAGAVGAGAATPDPAAGPLAVPTEHEVFVQTDNPDGNQVVVYDRGPQGTLSFARAYATGGLGGVLSGSIVDHLASEGSLVYDWQNQLLLATNAGSNSVSAFSVVADRLVLRQVIGSGGLFPVSIAVRGNLVYVLNALGGGAVQGFVIRGGGLEAVPGRSRPLGLDPNATPQFTNTPGQVAISPDAQHLFVTTKANSNAIDVFGLSPSGDLSATPVVTTLPGAVPFAVAFDATGNALVTEAGPNTIASFAVGTTGTLSPISTTATGQQATCWITGVNSSYNFFASNAGSGSVTATRSVNGQLSGNAATATDPGTVDAALTPSGQWLYVQTGATGTVDEYRVSFLGGLTRIGSITVPHAQGGEGIVTV